MGFQAEIATQEVGRHIAVAEVSREEVADLCEIGFTDRLFHPLVRPNATLELTQQREAWRKRGETVVFTSGVFDLFHLNHAALLQYARISAVPYHYATHDAQYNGMSWDQLTPEQQRSYRVAALSSGVIRQVVSIDGNDHVSARKNGVAGKPGIRPAYDWQTRARDTLMASFAADGITPRFLADAVTIHDGQIEAFAGTPHAGIMEIGAHIQPDVWAVHAESQDIIDALAADADGIYEGIQPVILTHRGPYVDSRIGDISTSQINEYLLGALSLGSA